MKPHLLSLAEYVRDGLISLPQPARGAGSNRVSPGGDAQFDIDEVAERLVLEGIQKYFPEGVCVYTEDGAKMQIGDDDSVLLLIDPIDGTRPAAAGFQQAMISIATLPNRDDAIIGDVSHALLMNIVTGHWLYSDSAENLEISWDRYRIRALDSPIRLEKMFWSFELNGHPMHLMSEALGDLVDATANTGGVFVFNSCSYSIASIILGQTDAYVDIGNRILKDHPLTEPAFRQVGRGSILHLFPYDIAAAVTLAKRCGIAITDAYGQGFESVLATDLSPSNQRSCVAAVNPELHATILEHINFNLNGAPDEGVNT